MASQFRAGEVWSERESGDWEACVAASYAMGLLYGGVTMAAPYTQAEREKLEVVADEPQDLAATDGRSQTVYGAKLRGPSVTSSESAFLARPGIGFCLTGTGSPLGYQSGSFTHEVFAVGKSSSLVTVYDPLAPAGTAPTDMTISALAAWMKGIGSNQVREIAKGALAAMDPIPSADFAHIVNRKTTTVKDAPFLTAPIVGAAAHRTIPKGTAVVPVVLDEGAGGPWYGCWLYDDAPAGYVLGWFGPGNLNPLEPNEAPELPPGEPPPGSGDYEQGQADERAKWQEWMAARPISVQETWLEAAPDDS